MNLAGNTNPDMMGSHSGIAALYGASNRSRRRSRQFDEDERLDRQNTKDKAALMKYGADINDWQQRRASGVDSDEELAKAGGHIGAGMRSAVAATQVMGPNGEMVQLGGGYQSGAGVNVNVGGHAPISPKEPGPRGGGVTPPSGPHPGGLGPQMDGIIDNPVLEQRKERSKISTGREGRLVSSEGEGIRMESKRIGQKDIKERVAQAGRGVPLVTDAQKEMFKTADMVPTESRPSGRGQRHWQATPRGESQTRLESLESERPSAPSEDKDYGDIGPKADARIKDALKAKKASSVTDTPMV
jgi:hypothetical protein